MEVYGTRDRRGVGVECRGAVEGGRLGAGGPRKWSKGIRRGKVHP